MALTAAQQQLIKAEINNDPTLFSFPNTNDGAFGIALLLNLTAVPDFIVWKTRVPTADCKIAMVWTEYIGRSAGERDAWTFMLSNGLINAADINIRQGVQDIFSGPGGAQSRANLIEIAKRRATRGEKILANGSGTQVSPGTMTFEGNLTFDDVGQARNS